MPADKTRSNLYQPRVSGQLPDLRHPQNVTSASFGARDCRLFERLSRRPHLRPFEDRLENRIPVVCVGHRPCMSLLTHVPLVGCSGLLAAFAVCVMHILNTSPSIPPHLSIPGLVHSDSRERGKCQPSDPESRTLAKGQRQNSGSERSKHSLARQPRSPKWNWFDPAPTPQFAQKLLWLIES